MKRLSMVVLTATLFATCSYAKDDSASTDNQAPAVDTWERSYSESYSDATIRLSVTKPSSHSKSDLIKIERGGESLSIPLPDQIGQVSNIARVSRDRFAIFQAGTAPYSEVSLLDTRVNTFTATITCYSPSLSPDHRYLAYTKFYPPHGSDNSVDYSDFAMIYDFAKTPIENLDPSRDLPEDKDTFGYLQFPARWSLEPESSYNGNIPTYSVVSPFVWAPDSTKFVFLSTVGQVNPDSGDITELDNKAMFVIVKLVDGVWKTYTFQKDICGGVGGGACAPSMISAKFLPDDLTVKLTGVPRGSVTLQLHISDFQPL